MEFMTMHLDVLWSVVMAVRFEKDLLCDVNW
jgi:hypothetical protein